MENAKSRRSEVFESKSFVPTGEVRFSEAALNQPAGTLRDLLPGQWGFGQTHSILADRESGRLVVDTYDQIIHWVSDEHIKYNPAIVRVNATINNTTVFGYVADLSHVQSLLYLHAPMGLDSGENDAYALEKRRKMTGAQLLGGVVLREFGRQHYYGEEAFCEQAAMFSDQLNDFAIHLKKSATPLPSPGMAIHEKPPVHPTSLPNIESGQSSESS